MGGRLKGLDGSIDRTVISVAAKEQRRGLAAYCRGELSRFVRPRESPRDLWGSADLWCHGLASSCGQRFASVLELHLGARFRRNAAR